MDVLVKSAKSILMMIGKIIYMKKLVIFTGKGCVENSGEFLVNPSLCKLEY